MSVKWGTPQSFNHSNLNKDPSLFFDLGINLDTDNFPNVHFINLKPTDLMQFGARFEDGCNGAGAASDQSLCANSLLFNTTDYTVFHHFYDPQNNGLGLSINWLLQSCGTGISSVDWVTERNTQYNNEISYCGLNVGPQRYSYVDALDYFNLMMSASDKAMRDQSAGRLFQSLGHIVHHIHDMAQPEHVRNDLHCPTEECRRSVVFYDPSTLEKITERIFQECVKSKLNSSSIYAPDVNSILSPADFWDSGNGRGMAEFTSQNFVSPDTNFIGGTDYTNGGFRYLTPHVNYPQPSPDFTNTAKWNIEEVNISDVIGQSCNTQAMDNISKLKGKLRFITNTITDLDGSNKQYPNVRISTWSVFTDDLKKKTSSGRGLYLPKFSLNHFNYESYYDVLLPRAVGYSAGLINYFFRGRLGVTSSGNTIIIQNRSTQNMNGVYALYYDDNKGERRQVTTINMSLTPNQISSPISFSVPPGAVGNYVVVFDGEIGTYRGVAAKTFTGPITIIPCGSPVNYPGGSETWNKSMTLGSTEGNVEFEFEAYSIPDEFEIKLGNTNSTIISSGGQISGYDKYSFYWKPNNHPNTTFVDIKVTGNSDENTRWIFTMGCPGQSINSSGVSVDRVNVKFTNQADKVSGICSRELWINSKYVARLSPTNSEFYYTLTVGDQHNYEFRNKQGQCSINPISGGSWILKYKDRSGTYTLENLFYSTSNSGMLVVQ